MHMQNFSWKIPAATYKEFISTELPEYDADGLSLIDDKHFDKAFMNANVLEGLGFNEHLTEIHRPILKIVANGRVIYRKFYQGANKHITKDHIGLLKKDRVYLKIHKTSSAPVKVKLANFFEAILYYFYNPKEDLRIAARLAILAIPISFLFGLLVNYLYDWLKVTFGLLK